MVCESNNQTHTELSTRAADISVARFIASPPSLPVFPTMDTVFPPYVYLYVSSASTGPGTQKASHQ